MHTLLLLARLGLFALSLAGWCLWAARRFALPVEQTPLVAISAIGCAMCGAGLLNILTPVRWALTLGGLAALIWVLVRRREALTPWLSLRGAAFPVMSAWLLVLTRGGLVPGHDNFAHWAIMAKTVVTQAQLPNTANTAVECIDKLRDTMQSHERCAVVEVMGRHAGYLALYVGVAVGATAVLVPEHPYDFHSQVAEKIRHARLNGKTNFMIVVAEGAASAVDVGRQIQEELALDPRVTILGHIQRGGSPTAKDRVMATRMGYEAVRILAEGKTNRVICTKDDQIIDLDIDEGLAMKKTLNSEEFKVMTVMTGM